MCGNPPVKHSVAQKHGVSMETVLGKFPGEENHPRGFATIRTARHLPKWRPTWGFSERK